MVRTHEVVNVLFGHMLMKVLDWHEIPLRETILHAIARISSRVFLGEELCRNEE